MLAWEPPAVLAVAAEVCGGGILSLVLHLGRPLQQPLAWTQGSAFALGPPHPQEHASRKLFSARLWAASRSCLCYMDPETDLKAKL